MADPQNPFDQFDNQQSAADQLGRSVFTPVPRTPSPAELYHPMTPQERQSLGLSPNVSAVMSGTGKPEVVSGGGDKITYRGMTGDEKRAAGLDVNQPFYIGSNGLPALPQGAKGATTPIDPEQARAHVSDILNQIDHASKLLDAPLTTGFPGSIFGHISGTNAYTLRSLIGDTNDPNNPGQITGDLRQQGIAMLRALNGGAGVGTIARSQQEQQALQSAMSNIRQGLPADELKTALHSVGQIYRRALARSYGINPESPSAQAQFGIDPLWQPPGGYHPEVNPAPPIGQAHDNGITTSASPPTIGVNGGQGIGVSSGETKSIADPNMARIAPQLEKYLSADPRKVSNAMILGFMQKQGVDPSQTSIGAALQYRMSKEGAAWRAQGGGYSVDPHYNAPLHGIEKVRAEVSGSPEGAGVLGAADTATLGTIPDVAGVFHAATGLGPSRADVVTARDASASEHPLATFLGNLAGGALPLGRAGEVSAAARAARSAGAGGAYGFFGSDDPNIESRLFNAGEGTALAGITHGVSDAAMRGVQAGYRGVTRPLRNVVSGSEATADRYALDAAARKMPLQGMSDVNAADAASRATGVPAPAAASINRGGQDFLARLASGSPAARAVVDSVAKDTRAAIPHQLAGDFNDAIEAASPNGGNAAEFLNRPIREITRDIQGTASREYERGIQPIANAKLTISPDLVDTLAHERIAPAIRQALTNHQLSDDTRNVLRALPQNLAGLNSVIATPTSGAEPAAVAALQAQVRGKYAAGIPLTVDAARNIATALDDSAAKLQDGSEAAVNLHQLSGEIRHAIADQYPEFQSVNARYGSRMRAIEAADNARRNFFASTPEQMDALAKSSRRFTDAPNEAEYGATPSQSGPNGFVVQMRPKPLPSNRQLAMAGAREAATVRAGENGAGTADRLANNVNQQSNNETVLGPGGAQSVGARAAVRSNVAGTVDRIASGASADRTENWFNLVKQAVVMKATGGSGHYAVAHAAASVPGLSSSAAARVVRLYLDADSAPQVLHSLTSTYGARRARFIMGRMAAITAAASGVRGFAAQTAR